MPGVAAAAKQMGLRGGITYSRPSLSVRGGHFGTATAACSRRSPDGNAAVGVVGPVEISGHVAWLFWLLVHLWYLIGFRNRVIVLFDWAWAYISFQRSARIFSPRS